MSSGSSWGYGPSSSQELPGDVGATSFAEATSLTPLTETVSVGPQEVLTREMGSVSLDVANHTVQLGAPKAHKSSFMVKSDGQQSGERQKKIRSMPDVSPTTRRVAQDLQALREAQELPRARRLELPGPPERPGNGE